ncbi:hypothetical protein LUZ60_015515 [Juncus effusus]|nr:hypothetical protein LUZ60_015515 [Juncus effusus]
MAVLTRLTGMKRLATLVGCNYKGSQYELHGCINDVFDMQETLISRFGFDKSDVTVLTDEPGSNPLPTGANVKRILGEMIGKAKSGDVLFFHYSGHGTLIPAVKPYHGRKDEAIVPCDFNLITDLDFRQLVDKLPSGTSFTIISDSCHSGGLIDKEKEQIGPTTSKSKHKAQGKTRFISYESLGQHLGNLSGLDSPHVGEHLLHIFGEEASSKFHKDTHQDQKQLNADNGILLSGCQTNETSADIGAEEGDGKPCGAFSHSLQKVIKEHPAVISNKELVTKARKLLQEEHMSQHPCLYCSDGNADKSFLLENQE